jgi:hypothetical protein
MAQRLVRFSDLTNKMIQDDEVVRIVIEQHPALQNGPVELEAAPDEAEAIRTSVLNVVSLKLYQDDSTSPEIVTMEIEAFNRLAGDMDMEDVLRKAQPAHTPRKPTRPAAASAADKLDYTSLEHAGKPTAGRPQMPRRRSSGITSIRSTSGLSETDCESSGWMTPRW